jgi:hypothetical protein
LHKKQRGEIDMAELITPAGEIEIVQIPSNSLADLQKHVGGYIEIIRLENDFSMVVNEEGLLEGLEYNQIASEIAAPHHIVGNAVVCSPAELGEEEEDNDEWLWGGWAHQIRGPWFTQCFLCEDFRLDNHTDVVTKFDIDQTKFEYLKVREHLQTVHDMERSDLEATQATYDTLKDRFSWHTTTGTEILRAQYAHQGYVWLVLPLEAPGATAEVIWNNAYTISPNEVIRAIRGLVHTGAALTSGGGLSIDPMRFYKAPITMKIVDSIILEELGKANHDTDL